MNKNNLVLTGKSLELKDIEAVACGKRKVEIDSKTFENIVECRQLIYELAESETPVYGFNRGVGMNKDREVMGKYFSEYNRNLILAHCVSVGEPASEEVTRATVLARLNSFLIGCTGIQPEIVLMYRELLNREIHPVIPSKGSIGEGDIGCLSHIGLAIIGEGEVIYKGERMASDEALKKEGLTPIILGPKDGLAIVSSNALSSGKGALVLNEIERLVDTLDLIYALSLEGLRGNVTPLEEKPCEYRGFLGQKKSMQRVRDLLEGSYLWLPGVTESLQDPLSYRGSCQVHGSLRDALEYTREYLTLQLNTSDDNPCLLKEERRIISCANYEPTTWVLGFEMLGVALSHVSRNACYRTIKLANPKFTGLSRFLTPSDTRVIAYGTIQKTFAALDAENRHLSNPTSVDYLSLAGDIEDRGTNSVYVVEKTGKIVDNIWWILAIELLHASQAIDLRKATKLGKGTKPVYEAVRKAVPFLEQDRNLTKDIETVYCLLKNGNLLNI
ncbi:HAL/PAL/TAL family ammonia-lyase [Tindallia californiensis]|uniref:Histidine ammonia-lyase n=1 Tax=Tindallia californiensis TaxID=159292 RepID=A0A1H3MI16_9FIRM|nr:aromatic amino acid ammonia-lyase [Tindallia californiensis]SDY75984.1 histidine ammonia-lyase [Tindallia californiensis]